MKKLKNIKEGWDKTTQSADKKPEKYTDKDGKVKIRMVPTKREEVDEVSLKDLTKTIAKSTGTKNIKKAMNVDKVKKDLEAMKAKLATNEKTLTPAEKKKREEIAKAMEKDNPGMDMKKKMAIATWQAKKVAEETEILEAQDPEMEKVKQLVRLGLMDKKDMTKIVRALTLMKDGKAVPQKERKILFDMLGELIGMITGHDAMFNKARKAVKEEKDMNGMCCKHCGDEFGKPKSESCMYDAYNPEGKNWIKKESYTEAKDPGEYDNEGAMAKTQLKGILSDADHMIKMFSDDENLPEWVQNKITKAADYLNSAHRYMMNDDDAQTNESVNEILDTPKAMQSYRDKAKYSRDRASGSATAKILSKGTLGSHKPELDTMRKRHKGMDMVDRLAKRKTRAKLVGKNESATNMRNMKLINKIKKSGTVKSGSMSKDKK